MQFSLLNFNTGYPLDYARFSHSNTIQSTLPALQSIVTFLQFSLLYFDPGYPLDYATLHIFFSYKFPYLISTQFFQTTHIFFTHNKACNSGYPPHLFCTLQSTQYFLVYFTCLSARCKTYNFPYLILPQAFFWISHVFCAVESMKFSFLYFDPGYPLDYARFLHTIKHVTFLSCNTKMAPYKLLLRILAKKFNLQKQIPKQEINLSRSQHKATLMLTVPRFENKSSIKDLT